VICVQRNEDPISPQQSYHGSISTAQRERDTFLFQ
jgi:hypothetical protein